MICSTCSGQINQGAQFCTCCGRPIQPQEAYPQDRLVRPRHGRMIAGVCAGLAQREGWDPTLIRILAVVCFFGGFGMVLVAYIAGWVIMPNEPVWFAAPPHSTPDASVAAS